MRNCGPVVNGLDGEAAVQFAERWSTARAESITASSELQAQ
jgi:hypothetical protein